MVTIIHIFPLFYIFIRNHDPLYLRNLQVLLIIYLLDN